MNGITEPLAPLSDERVRELTQLTRNGPEVVALAQEVARSRAKLGFPLAPPGDPAYIEAPATDCVICFDDPDQGIAVFTGAGAESAARRRLEELRQNWTCHLFVSPDPRDERIAALEADNARLQHRIDDAEEMARYRWKCSVSESPYLGGFLSVYDSLLHDANGRLRDIALALGLPADAEPDAVLAAAKGRQWIAVADAAPPQDGTRIFVMNDNGAFAVEWHAIDGFSWWFCQDGKHDDRPLRGSAPSHWMRIPANEGAKR